jgi:hypothetical protein
VQHVSLADRTALFAPEPWGDGQVYLWYRGIWGNDAVKSALMALEQWALEKLDTGAAFDDIFRKVVEGNDSVAALGLGASLCLAYPGALLAAAFPLVTCPYLWEWDIPRVTQERSPTNVIGNWHQYRMQLTAVRNLNQKSHRKRNIRDLVLYFVLADDKKLVTKFTKSIRSFPKRLPISYEEEKTEAAHMAALQEKMALFAAQADRKYLKTAPTADGLHIQIWIDPPYLQKTKYKEQQDRHLQLNEWMAVALWANKSLESGSVDGELALEDGLAKARRWDEPGLFDNRAGAFEERYRAAAVAGAAYVAAKHCSGEAWTGELAAWCLDVLERAATGPDAAEELMVRSASLLMHPALFAVHGYSALLARGVEVERCREALLSLATDALQEVQTAVFVAAKDYAATESAFYWVLLDLMVQQWVVQREEIPDIHTVEWDRLEAERKVALLDRATIALASRQAPVLPAIPMPWIKGGVAPRRARRDMKGYVRNETVFLWDIAGKIPPHIYLVPVLEEASRRAQFLKLVGELLEFTFQEMVPPFATSRRDHNGHTAYEWVYAFSAWCGKLCIHLSREEAQEQILSPIWAQPPRSALLMLQTLMRTFMIRAFLTPAEISRAHITLWSAMADWLFSNAEWARNGREEYLDHNFTCAAFTLLFCAAPDFSPLICGIDPGWPHLNKFLPIIKRAICEFGVNETLYLAVITFLRRGGSDFLPEPALAWLRTVVETRKGDRKFWEANGESTVELLKQLIAQKGGLLSAQHHRAITVIADILVDDGVRGAGFLQQELLRAG